MALIDSESPAALGRDPSPSPASWIRRVAAVLLDTALLSLLAFLTSNASGSGLIIPTFSSEPASNDVGSALWLIAGLIVLLVMQSLTGATPGKRIVGIVVVDDRALRPVGVWRTAVRWLAHLTDAILMIGYLRPLWHQERRTFADSLCATLVVVDARPERSRVVTVGAIVACSVAVLFHLAPTDGTGADYTMRCESGPHRAEASVTEVAFTRTMLGITRSWSEAQNAQFTWESPNDTADQPNFVVTFFSADGSERTSVSSNSVGGGDVVTVSGTEIQALGDDWTWTAQWTNSSGPVAECRAKDRL